MSILTRALALLAFVTSGLAVAGPAAPPASQLFALQAKAQAATNTTAIAAKQAQLSPAQKTLVFPARVQVRQVMASPPSISWASSCSSISSPLFVPALHTDANVASTYTLNPLFYYRKGGRPVQAGTSYPTGSEVKLSSVNYGSVNQANVTDVPIITDGGGTGVCFALGDNSGIVTFKIDGQYASLSGHNGANSGAIEYGFVPLTDGNLHEVEVIGGPTVRFAGVSVPATATLLPAPPRGPRVIVLGDSGVEGTGATAAWNTMIAQFGDALGWDNVMVSGVGSTGAINPGVSPKINWLARIPTDVCPFNPAIVVVPGSINDSSYTPAQITAQYQAIVNAIKAPGCAPNAQIVLASAWLPKGGAGLPANYYLNNYAIKAVATANGLPFIDQVELPTPDWFTPQSTTLQSAVTSTSAGTKIYTTADVQIGGTYAFADGSHLIIKDSSYSASTGYSHNVDGVSQIEPTGATLTQVGGSAVTGNGRTNNLNNNGNADKVTGTDATHPTDFGHQVDGTSFAIGFLNAIRPNN